MVLQRLKEKLQKDLSKEKDVEKEKELERLDKYIDRYQSQEVLFPLPDKGGSKKLLELAGSDKNVAAIKDEMVRLSKTWCKENIIDSLNFFENDDVFPIKGIQNYYPLYSGVDAYKNAVTGDYDLFACWPYIPAGGLADLVRQSELTVAGEKPDALLFSKVSSKRFAIRSNVTKNVFVEFIPRVKEITPLEHSSFGNANNFVFNVAATLNSFAAITPGPFLDHFRSSKKFVRNVAFHSDEGGRPNLDAVDYNIGAFVPEALLKNRSIATELRVVSGAKSAQMYLITNHVELLTLINAVKGKCNVTLNYAWVYDFLKSDDAKVKALLKTIFCTASNDETNSQDKELSTLKTKFMKLFPKKNDQEYTNDVDAKSEEKIKFILNPDENAEPPSAPPKVSPTETGAPKK